MEHLEIIIGRYQASLLIMQPVFLSLNIFLSFMLISIFILEFLVKDKKNVLQEAVM